MVIVNGTRIGIEIGIGMVIGMVVETASVEDLILSARSKTRIVSTVSRTMQMKKTVRLAVIQRWMSV
jgi:hypothetical protein